MKTKFLGLLLVAAVVVSGCGDSSASSDTSDSTDSIEANKASSFPVVVQTASGDVTISARPTKIVSLAPTATEMLFAVHAGEQVIAVDDQSNYPANVPKSTLSGFTPNVEAIAAKQPDLVVLSSDIDNAVASLTTLKIPTLLLPAAKTVDDTYNQITALGKATGHTGEADGLVEDMKDEITNIKLSTTKRTTPLTYYYELDTTYYSVTSQSFVGSLLAELNLKNIADEGNASNSYPQLSPEKIAGADPDVILLADTKCCNQNAQTVAQRPGWANISAVKNNKVVLLDDDVASRWGPRIVDLLRQVAEATSTAR